MRETNCDGGRKVIAASVAILPLSIMRIVVLLLTLFSIACASRPSLADDGERAILRTADRFFEAMEARDAVTLKKMLHPRAQMIAIVDGEARIRSGEEWLSGITSANEPLRERMWDRHVQVDEGLATLWGPYDFHRGEKFSHCGTNAFHFVRSSEEWLLLNVTFTVRKDGCESRPSN